MKLLKFICGSIYYGMPSCTGACMAFGIFYEADELFNSGKYFIYGSEYPDDAVYYL